MALKIDRNTSLAIKIAKLLRTITISTEVNPPLVSAPRISCVLKMKGGFVKARYSTPTYASGATQFQAIYSIGFRLLPEVTAT